MECVLGVPFGYEPNEELRKLLEDFRDMVNFCILRLQEEDNLLRQAQERGLRGVEAQVELLHALLPLSLQDSAGDAQDLQEEA